MYPQPVFDPRMALYNSPYNMPYMQQQNLESYGAVQPEQTPYDMEPPTAYGKGARRQLNCLPILLAIAVPVAFFVATFCLMCLQLHFSHPDTSCLLILLAFFFVLVIGAGATQAHRKQIANGERSWLSFIFGSSLLAALLGVALGYVNYSSNTKAYYDYISLRKAVDVEPGQNQGQQVLDAGEIDFKVGTQINRNMSMAYHKSATFCVAPIVPAGATLLASYDFWAVGKDCCSSRPGDFSCGSVLTSWETGNLPPAGLRVMDNSEIAGYTLALEQASAAYNIQSGHAIFLYMQNTPSASPYMKIKAYFTAGRDFAMIAIFGFAFLQTVFVVIQAQTFGKRAYTGYLDIEKTAKGHFAH